MARTANPTPIRHGFAVVLCAALPALAQTLGDIEVRSVPGEPLDATIALGTAAGAPVGAECVFLSRGAPEDGPFVTRANVAVYEDGGTRFIRLKSSERVSDPKSRLRIVIQCPGLPHVAYREYRALFTPAPAPAPAPALAPVQPPVAGAFPVRPGDSLESLATLMFPRQRETQRAYIEALRERNPALANLAPRDPIPADAAIELPDLRNLPKVRAPAEPARSAEPTASPPARAARPTPPPVATAPAAPPPPVAQPVPRKASPAPAPKAQAPAKSEPPPRPVAPPRVAAAPAAAADGRFALRLSGTEIDLTRSRGIDDAQRAKLRERLLVLDNDDQVSALLALRDSMKRLEGRVAELQLKLSGMPATLPTAPRAEPPSAKAAPVLPPKVEPAPKIEAPKIEAPQIEPPKPEPPKAIAPVVPEPPPAAATRPEPKPLPAKKAASTDWGFALSDALWGVVALLVLLAIAFAWHLVRRRQTADAEEALPDIPSSLPPATAQPRAEPSAGVGFDVAEPVAVATPVARREIASDANLATEVPSGDPATLRRRYLEQRFPEIASGAIALSDPDSVVKAARLLYEDGALPRAVELLQYATEENPDEQKHWLALFEIFRLERLKGQFADLAQRYRDRHGHEGNWRKVQFFGREIDPGNPLYRDLSVGIETIKFEAGVPPPPVTFDPIAENWLNAPMDFENELLMADLRRALMEEAKLTDPDLAPNPMPALRRVEMFTVA
jgi:hypothetical protein